MNKSKKRLTVLLLILVVLLTGSIMIANLSAATVAQAIASSDLQLSADTLAKLDVTMKSDTFIHNATIYHIDPDNDTYPDYYNNLHGNKGATQNSPRVSVWIRADGGITPSSAKFNIADPITSLIPIGVFAELASGPVGVFTHMEKNGV